MPDSWLIPAKTFLLGEYAALKGQSALIITTTPCFELRKTLQPGLQGIHPNSPAGRWWSYCAIPELGLSWHDPYAGLGGLGASSAQFLAVYLACAESQNQTVEKQTLLRDYRNIASNSGVEPSGYDVLAQYTHGCCYINRQTNSYQSFAWPFTDLGFILLHSQHKLATHDHLQSLRLSQSLDHMSNLVDHAKSAFLTGSSYHLIETIKAYHQALSEQGWVAEHTLKCVQRLYQETDALAIKGCGAMGADVILLLIKQNQIAQHAHKLKQYGWRVLATHKDLFFY